MDLKDQTIENQQSCIETINKPCIETINKPCIETINKPCIETINKPVINPVIICTFGRLNIK
jgi:hypothetical protein